MKIDHRGLAQTNLINTARRNDGRDHRAAMSPSPSEASGDGTVRNPPRNFTSASETRQLVGTIVLRCPRASHRTPSATFQRAWFVRDCAAERGADGAAHVIYQDRTTIAGYARRISGRLLFFFVLLRLTAGASTFTIGDSDFLLNGRPFQIKAGEMHPGRIPHEYWRDRLKMAHAMGLNTVSIYVFWNQHEPKPGEFKFSGDTDIAEFVREAQAEGLWVIVRPGPYCCAEWEFGGLPWWLLKQPDMKVRSQDPKFLAAADKYMKKLGEKLAPLQITRGGPIIMVQVENEYGSFGDDHVYMGKIRDSIKNAGFDVPLFTADGGGKMMVGGSLPDVLPGLNGGDGPDITKEIEKYRPHGPWFVPELYPGWLDHWGESHAHTGIDDLVRETEWKLTNHISFCYYVIHGGTSFGFTSGANFGKHFQPQPTSYDYDAPIDEAGRPTKKYFALREVFGRHLSPPEALPPVPPTNPSVIIPNIQFSEAADLSGLSDEPERFEKPRTFEDVDQGYGYILYRTEVIGPRKGTLKIKELRDYAVVSVNGKRVATLDRRYNQDSVPLDLTNQVATLDILVENGGRINYGRQMLDNHKGITESVTMGDSELTGWAMYKLPFDDVTTLPMRTNVVVTAPCVRHGGFELSQAGDGFLDLREWGKGIVIINGHNLGRYWNIGPQQTLFVPGVWLRPGHNDVWIFEELKDGVQKLAGIDKPILDQLNPDPNAPVDKK